MRLSSFSIAALLLLVAPSGCDFYFGDGHHGDDDDDCATVGAEPYYDPGLRNPETGQCEEIGYPPPVPCYGYVQGETDPGSPTPNGSNDRDPVALPAWAACYDACSDLDERTCRIADGCRAIYINPCIDADCLAVPTYAACWGTSPTGPIRGGGCWGLDSFACSQHDDCLAVHHPLYECPAGQDCTRETTPGNFGYCEDEEPSPPPPPPVDCATVTSERECIEASRCQPLYEGSECQCDPSGCDCALWTYVSCQDR